MNANKIKLTNTSKKSFKLVIEPWGDEYVVHGETTVEVVADDDVDSKFELEVGDGIFIVHGWGNDMWVCCEGKKIEPFSS